VNRPPLAIWLSVRTFGDVLDHGFPFASGIPAVL
jgi:hypothetical protein